MSRRRLAFLAVALSVLLLSIPLLAACGTGSPIPSGAQQVHVVVSASAVEIEPSTVRAGDVYIALEAGSLTFVEKMTSPDDEPGPLTPDDLERLRRGDTQGMAISGLDAGGCDPQQNADARGQTGPCGNVMLVTVSPGAYAIVGGPPEEPGSPIGVLEVVP
jgi:hypothetical protein